MTIFMAADPNTAGKSGKPLAAADFTIGCAGTASRQGFGFFALIVTVDAVNFSRQSSFKLNLNHNSNSNTNMKIIRPGHRYLLDAFEQPGDPQVIQFIQKEPDPHGGDELITVNNGTTNEDLLRVLIDRLAFLHAKFPSKENEAASQHLNEALMWLEERTRQRKARGVEGKHLA